VSSFELSEANMATVIRICERLEGIPLAIELASAKFGILPLEQLSARLDDRFRLLAGRKSGALARHQTLEATLDWSYDLLDGQERTLLARLSVFSGGASFEAVEAVCGGQDVGVDVLEPLSQLVSKSLVTLVRGYGEARYRLLETVRSYASQRLSASGQAGALRDRHCDWCLALAEDARSELLQAHQRAWIRRLDREYENLRAALDWSTASRPNDGLRLAVALAEFWFRKARYSEGLEWLQRALGASTDRSGTRADALTSLGIMARWRGDRVLARQSTTEAVRMAADVGDETAKAWATEKLALVLDDEHLSEAIPLFKESVALGRKANRLRLPSALNNLGSTLHQRGDRSELPRITLAEGLLLAREQGDHWAVAAILDSIAQVALDTTDFETARLSSNESLSIALREGHDNMVPFVIEGIAKRSLLLGQPDRALRLLAASERFRRENGFTLAVPSEGDALQRLVSDARQALAADQAENAWSEGQRMSLAEVVEYATHESGAAQPAFPALVR
jgi:non-specific serine/threonine protein kinase